MIEERDEKGEQDWNPEPLGPKTSRGNLFGRGGNDFVRLRINLSGGSIRLDTLQDGDARLTVTFASQQPARAFGNGKAEHRIKQGRKRRHAQHPTPVIFAGAREQPIGTKGNQYSKDDVELKHAG